MKRITFVVFVLVLWLATCSAPEPDASAPMVASTQTAVSATETAVPPTPPETLTPGL